MAEEEDYKVGDILVVMTYGKEFKTMSDPRFYRVTAKVRMAGRFQVEEEMTLEPLATRVGCIHDLNAQMFRPGSQFEYRLEQPLRVLFEPIVARQSQLQQWIIQGHREWRISMCVQPDDVLLWKRCESYVK